MYMLFTPIFQYKRGTSSSFWEVRVPRNHSLWPPTCSKVNQNSKSKILSIRIKSKMLPINFFQNKEQNTTHQKQRANAPYQNKSNCSPSRISSKTRIKRSRLESVCSSNGAPLYNTIQYNNIAQTDSNQENKTLIKERKTMPVKVLM